MKPTVIDTSFFLPNQQFFTQSIGYNETLLHTHTFFELFFVDSGKAIHNINGKNETVQQNDLVFSFLSYLFSFLISGNISRNEKNDYPFRLTQLLSILNSGDSLKKSKQEIFSLLDNFSYNQAYISRVFSQYTGKTITRYINQIRFSTAYTLLVATDMSIPDILEYIGIEGKPYFYREFQKRYHVTPIQLRKSPQIRRD